MNGVMDKPWNLLRKHEPIHGGLPRIEEPHLIKRSGLKAFGLEPVKLEPFNIGRIGWQKVR